MRQQPGFGRFERSGTQALRQRGLRLSGSAIAGSDRMMKAPMARNMASSSKVAICAGTVPPLLDNCRVMVRKYVFSISTPAPGGSGGSPVVRPRRDRRTRSP